MPHISLKQYLLVLEGAVSWDAHLRACHQHLLETCPSCRDDWEGSGGFVLAAEGDSALENRWAGSDDEDIDPLKVRLADVEACEERLTRKRTAARLARIDLQRLLREPISEWRGMVERATRRCRSRAFALLLIEESRKRVRTSPEVAGELASLVPIAICRSKEASQLPWVRKLVLRASAHRANGLRVGGDLPAADRVFSEIRKELRSRPPNDPSLEAEILSLEASLRIGRRDLILADELLQKAVALQRQVADHEGLARTLIKHANLLGTLGRNEDLLTLSEEASELIGPEDDPFLFTCNVTAQVNALCDLNRPSEADSLLAEHEAWYSSRDDEHVTVSYQLLRARVDLGLGNVSAAVDGFAGARDGFMALGRHYDTMIVGLHLADALHLASRFEELKELASELVPLFRSQGVAREALAALRLLVDAARAQTVTTSLIARVREALLLHG